MEKILVLDFGGQYNQLIARRVRDLHVYAEIKPYNKITVDDIERIGYKRRYLNRRGPIVCMIPPAPHYDPNLLKLGIPVLGHLLRRSADGIYGRRQHLQCR